MKHQSKHLKREIKEEFNCSIEVGEKVEDTTYEYEKVIVRLETYMAKLLEGTPIALEHAETKWVTRKELHNSTLHLQIFRLLKKLAKEK